MTLTNHKKTFRPTHTKHCSYSWCCVAAPLGWFNLAIHPLQSHHRNSSLVFLSQHHWHRSHQAARFVFLFFCWTDYPAGCHHSVQRSWLIICQAPWGMRVCVSTTGPVFLRTAMEIRESESDPATLRAGREENVRGSKDKREWRREREKSGVVGLGLYQRQKVTQDCILQMDI